MKLRHLAMAAFASLALAAGAGLVAQSAPAPAPAAAWPGQGGDIAADPDVRFGTLPNGMRYALRHNATPPGQTSLRLRIDAGSLDEQDDQRGLAHFIEHMAFNGSTHVPEGDFVRRLERHGLRFGADTNASTEFDQTVYKLDMPESDAATLDEAVFLLREIASEVTFAPEAIDRERGVVQSEERSRATPQYHIATDQLGYLLSGQLLPTRWPIGVPEVIASARRDRFKALYDAYYRPERATLIVVGDFDLDAMEARIRAKFGDWRGRGAAGAEPDRGSVAARPATARLLVEAGGPATVSLSWVRPPDMRPDTQAVRGEKLIDALALQVLNRRLERIAAERSPAPFIAAQAVRSSLADSADLTQLVAVVQPGQWRPGLEAIETERRRLVAQGVTQAELDREITELRTALAAQVAGAATRQSARLADAIVASIEDHKVFNAPAETQRIFEATVRGLTPARVDQAARTMFAGDPLLYMTSPAAVEGGEAAVLAAWRAANAAPLAAAQARRTQTWPYTDFGTPGAIAERHELPADIGATAVRFANGVRLTVKHTDFADNQVLVRVQFGNGILGLPADRPSPAWGLAAGFSNGGLGRMTYEDMQQALSDRLYSAALGVGEDAFVLDGRTRPDDLAVQMQVLAAYVTDPGWRPTGWNRMRALGGTIQDQLAATPSGVFARDSGPLLHDGDRRFGLPTRAEMTASSIADARAALDGPLADAPIQVIIVGDVDVEQAIRQTAATFGALPPRAERPAPAAHIRFPAGNAEPVRLTHGGRDDQGLAFIGWPTIGFYDDTHEARTLNLLAQVFELRLIQRIREEQGTTYSPQGFHSASQAYPGYGLFGGQIEARPEALAGFLGDAQAIAGDLAARPIDADEMTRAQRPLIDSLTRQRAGNSWWIQNLDRIQTDPRVAETIENSLADYRSITPAELEAAARRFLVPDKAWKLVIVPRQPAPAPAP
jgi:zinc protease